MARTKTKIPYSEAIAELESILQRLRSGALGVDELTTATKRAKELIDMEEYRASMEGIYTTSVGKGTLDECPMAYKSMADIVDNIGPTAEIVNIIKPIYNFKAGNSDD